MKPYYKLTGYRKRVPLGYMIWTPVISVHTAAEFLWRVGDYQYEYSRDDTLSRPRLMTTGVDPARFIDPYDGVYRRAQ